MQVSPLTQPSSFWTNLTGASAALLAAVAFLVRWVLAPATRTYIREDLKPELEQVKKIPQIEQRVDRLEGAIEKLSDMPASLARIEGLLEERAR